MTDIRSGTSEEAYLEAKRLIEEPAVTDEDFLEDFIDDYDDDQVWEMCEKTLEMETPPDKSRILSKNLESIVLVDELPVAPKEKLARLEEVIKKKVAEELEKQSLNIEIKRMDIPYKDESEDPKQSSYGFALIQFATEQQAQQFQNAFRGFKFTKKSIWQTYNLSTIEKYNKVEEEWAAPTLVEKELDGDLEEWQNDENDQFLLMAKDKVDIYLNQCGYGPTRTMAPTGPMQIWGKNGMGSEEWDNIRWSPRGTYILVFDKHERGLGLFGGQGFTCKEKIQARCCFNACFSPDEQFLMTQSGRTDERGNFIESEVKAEVSIWSVLDSEKKKTFVFPVGHHCGDAWERFQWSPSGQFLATTRKDTLCIFDAWNNFSPVNDPESPNGFMHVAGLAGFTFSPLDDYVAYWVPEEGERPLRLCIRALPDLSNIRVKNLFNVKALEMLWHPEGTFLALKVSKTLKGKKGFLYNSFELFHIKEKEIPVDTIEIKDHILPYDIEKDMIKTENLGTMAWEKNGTRFVVMYGPNDAVTKTQVKVFKLHVNGKVKPLPPMERSTQYNTISWSPTGRYMCLAQLKKGQSSGGALEWLDVNGDSFTQINKYNPKTKNELQKPVTLATGTHQFLTDIEWDATGRYVVTSASAFCHKMENGYVMWNFLGRELYVNKLEGCSIFKWRPRPVSELTTDQIKSIKTNMSSYANKFMEYDAIRSTQVSEVEKEKIVKLMNAWNKRRSNSEFDGAEHIEYERTIYAEFDEDDAGIEEVTVNNLLNIKTEIRGRQKVLGSH